MNRNEYFSYVGRSLVNACCSNSGLHNDLYKRGIQGFFITFNRDLPTFRTVNIGETIIGHTTLDKAMAQANANELRKLGLILPLDFSKKYINSLDISYILNSSLCWVSVTTKKGKTTFFATKNPNILSIMSPHFAKTEAKKSFDNFLTQLNTSYSELTTGIFEVVTLTPDTLGLKLGKAKINCNDEETIITTMYSIGNYIDAITGFLNRHKVILTYIENDEEKSFVTSLKPALISCWLRTKNKTYINEVIKNSSSAYIFGQLTLPDLYKKNKFVTLHVLSIKSLHKFQQ